MKDAYQLAQRAVADLKAAVYAVLEDAPSVGLTERKAERKAERKGDIPK